MTDTCNVFLPETVMKILHVVPSYKPAYVYGGPIESVARLCETLAVTGVDVRVFTTTANGKTELDVEPNQTVWVNKVAVTYFRRITKDPTHVSLSLWWQLYKQCREFDVVHIHSWWNVLVIIAAVVCHIRGARVVISPRGMLSDYIINTSNVRVKGWIHALIGKWTLQKSVFHATAEAEYIECRKVIPGWHGFTLPNILQLPTESLPRTRNDVFTVIYLSRIHPKKGLEVLFEAISQLKEPVRLKIAGSGDESYVQTLKDKVAALQIGSSIDWIGWQSRENKFNQLSQADLFILPSFNENFANTVIESLSVGTPVLITPHVGLASYVQKNRLGWISELNASALTATITMAMLDNAGRTSVNERGRATILHTFSADTLAENYVNCYRESFEPKGNPVYEQVPV